MVAGHQAQIMQRWILALRDHHEQPIDSSCALERIELDSDQNLILIHALFPPDFLYLGVFCLRASPPDIRNGMGFVKH